MNGQELAQFCSSGWLTFLLTFTPRYRNALFHLLSAETSCYRYWGAGIWTDYGSELCRRVSEIVTADQ